MISDERGKTARRGIRVTFKGHPAGTTHQMPAGSGVTFWRAGLQFTLGQPLVLALADLTEAQLLRLRDEGMPQGRLVVEDIDDIDAIESPRA